jgi:hypothetical protein
MPYLGYGSTLSSRFERYLFPNETDVFHHHEMAITEDHWGFHYEVVDQALRLSYYPWDDTF